MSGLWDKLSGNVVLAANLRGQQRIPFLPRERLEALRDRRIRRIVVHAARTVPYYREWFARAGIDPRSIRGAGDLDRLPILDRELVRAEPQRFVAVGRAARGALSFWTSGSTGTPIQIHHDRSSLLANIAYGERERAPLIAACGTFRPKELYVGYETSTFKTVNAFYEAHTLLPVRPRRRFVSLLEPIEKIAAIANAERPDVLVGYGGWLSLFFRTVDARGIAFQPPKLVIYMGEALPHGARAYIEENFGVLVLSRYNAVEAFKIGFFCEQRAGFHLHEDLCHVRIVDARGHPAAPDELGQIVISNLVNRASVLLNYPIGDFGSLSLAPCPCGRTFTRLSELEGRVEDILALADGSFVHPRAVWQAFKSCDGLLQYQLTQRAARQFALTLVSVDEPAFRRVAEQALPALEQLLGPQAQINITRGSALDRRTGGKFRAVVALSPRRTDA